jgi:peptidoglycan hydrolase-like protein with peptidoglycan-binding domain
MTVMPAPLATGRGSWTKRGMRTTRGMYERGSSWGVSSCDTQDKWAVNRGVLAIQVMLGYNGYPVQYASAAGVFGPLTDASVIAFQNKFVAPADGIVGPNTSRALLRGFVASEEKKNGIPNRYLWGQIGAETGWDMGCIGYSTPNDLGICQFNLYFNQSVSPDQAMNPLYVIPISAQRLRTRYNEYLKLSGGNVQLAWDAAILSHNSPVRARNLASTGTYPTAQSEDYVTKVKAAARIA